MNKLFKFKEWVTIPAAARHLSLLLNDTVGESDILQMALEGHIKLSVVFPNKARAKLGKIIPYKDVPKVVMPDLDGNGPYTWPDGYPMQNLHEVPLSEDSPFLSFGEEVKTIDGIWDLSMLASERIDVEFELHQIIGGPPVELVNLEGTFLNRPDGTWASLQDRFDGKVVVDEKGGKKTLSGGYFPAGGLGDDCIKVVRTSELIEFQNRLTGTKDEKPLGTRERNSILRTIGGLLLVLESKGLSEAEAIRWLADNSYADLEGLSKSTLEARFSEAKKMLNN